MIHPKKHLPKVLVILVLAICVGLGVYYWFWFRLQPQTSNPTSTGPTTEQQAAQQKAETDLKKDFVETPFPKLPSTTTTNNTDRTISLNAVQESNGTVTIYTKLYGFPEGACALRVTNGSSTYSASAALMYQPEFSSCAGFSVPITKLGTGLWNITLDATSGGSTTSQSIAVEVH